MTGAGTATPTGRPAWRYLALLCGLLLFGGYSFVLAPLTAAHRENLAALILAVAAIALLQLMLRLELPMRAYVLLPLALLLPQLNGNWATYWHGFMHVSIVNEIYYRGGAPENPLMAGEPLRYMYAHHAALSWLMRAVPITPPQGFVLTDAISLAVFVIWFDRAVRVVTTDRAVRLFAGLLALCAISPLLRGPLATLVEHPWFGKLFVYRAEQRFIPLMKFVGINNNQLGLMFCAFAFSGLIALAAGQPKRMRAYVAITIALVGSGIYYPPCWLSIAACCGAVAAWFLLLKDPGMRRVALWLGVIVVAASAAVLPSMLGVTSGKSGSSSAIRVLLTYAHLRQNGAQLLILLAPAAALAWWKREFLLQWCKQQPRVAGALASIAAVSCLTYLVIAIPGPSEYKFVHMAVFALAIPLAAILGEIYRTSRIFVLVMLVLTIMPMTVDLVHQPPADTVADRVRSIGRDLRHVEPAQDALYMWIARETPRNAVFVDSYLTIPPLGHRQLLVGLDIRREEGGLRGFEHDGWLITAREFLTLNTGVNPDIYAATVAAARSILGAGEKPVDVAALRSLPVIEQGRPCYVVARRPEVSARLDALADFRRVYGNSAGTVYLLLPGTGAGRPAGPG